MFLQALKTVKPFAAFFHCIISIILSKGMWDTHLVAVFISAFNLNSCWRYMHVTVAVVTAVVLSRSYVSAENVGPCEKLEQMYIGPMREVITNTNVTISWDDQESRYVAGLLLATLRYGFGFRGLHVAKEPKTLCSLFSEPLSPNNNLQNSKLPVMVVSSWNPAQCPKGKRLEMNRMLLLVNVTSNNSLVEKSEPLPLKMGHLDVLCNTSNCNVAGLENDYTAPVLTSFSLDSCPPVIHPVFLEEVRKFKPSVTELNEMLRSQLNGFNDSNEAACTAISHRFQNENRQINLQRYISIFNCKGDSYNEDYKNLIIKLLKYINENTILPYGFSLNIIQYYVNCEDMNDLSVKFCKLSQYGRWNWCIGIVARGEGAAGLAPLSAKSNLPLLLLDAPVQTARASTGSAHHLSAALRHFVTTKCWQHLIIISDNTRLSRSLSNELHTYDDLVLKEYSNFSTDKIASVLSDLHVHSKRVVLINTEAVISERILSAAVKHEMTLKNGYSWIVREWQPNNTEAASLRGQIKHFSVSFCCRDTNDAQVGMNLSPIFKLMSDLWPSRWWPSYAVPLVNSLLTLREGFVMSMVREPKYFDSPHGEGALRSFWEGVSESTSKGHVYQYSANTLAASVILVDEWSGDHRTRVAVCHVNSDGVNKTKSLPAVCTYVSLEGNKTFTPCNRSVSHHAVAIHWRLYLGSFVFLCMLPKL